MTQEKQITKLLEWEEIAPSTYRLKVHGGWLVRVAREKSTLSHAVIAESLVFIPDSLHRWELETWRGW